LHQREIVAELERHGRSRTTQIARDILATFEKSQFAHLMTGRISCKRWRR
jgi:hypothetical protein